MSSESEFIMDLYQLAETCPSIDFQTNAFNALQEIIEFDSAAWGETANLVHTLHVLRAQEYNLPKQFHSDYNDVRHLNPLEKDQIRGDAVTIYIDLDESPIKLDEAFRAYIDKYDVPRMLQTNTLHDSHLFMYSIALWRKSSSRSFTETERACK